MVSVDLRPPDFASRMNASLAKGSFIASGAVFAQSLQCGHCRELYVTHHARLIANPLAQGAGQLLTPRFRSTLNPAAPEGDAALANPRHPGLTWMWYGAS